MVVASLTSKYTISPRHICWIFYCYYWPCASEYETERKRSAQSREDATRTNTRGIEADKNAHKNGIWNHKNRSKCRSCRLLLLLALAVVAVCIRSFAFQPKQVPSIHDHSKRVRDYSMPVVCVVLCWFAYAIYANESVSSCVFLFVSREERASERERERGRDASGKWKTRRVSQQSRRTLKLRPSTEREQSTQRRCEPHEKWLC